MADTADRTSRQSTAVAAASEEVSTNIADVNRIAGETRQAATHVQDGATRLGRQFDELQQEVDRFVSSLRNA